MLRKIASFTINHDTLTPGLYISRVDGGSPAGSACITYDLRCKWPNRGDYLPQAALHTIEHLVATYVRSSAMSDQVVYFGPMGCRTGFYLIMRDAASHQETIDLVKAAFAFAADFEGEIPGAKQIECGNYLEHDLPGAKAEAAAYVRVLAGCGVDTLHYPA